MDWFDDPSPDVVAGDPAADADEWHPQEEPDSCAVCAQEFVLEQLTGEQFSEQELRDEAQAHGWYEPGLGTYPEDIGKQLELHGVEAEQYANSSIDDIGDALDDGDKVIVGVDADELWHPGPGGDSPAEDQGRPGEDANHAVEVTGLADTPEGPAVVLNDSGSVDGAADVVPLDEFQSAWDDSGNFEVEASE